MKRHFILCLCFITVLIWSSGNIIAQNNGLKKIKWEKEKIASGLIWKSSHTLLNDSVPQNINILIVNLHKRRIDIQNNPLENIPVSKQAASVNAIAAVNGGFFNIKNGGSVTYLKTDGKIFDSDTAIKWLRNANMTGSILIKSGEEILIQQVKSNSWYDNHPEYDDVLVTGPLLVRNGIVPDLPQTSLVINRHPRTAIGARNSKKIIIVTLDGRTREAAGMTLIELTDLMLLFHCRNAVNLDGGGSTTMWINGKPFNGVVNMPCDNKKFDHEGERAVSDILIIR
jgi:exopolysaccharide biosynthesis protein